MFGSVSQWFVNWLGGIQPANDAVGFDRIVIRPQFVDGIHWVRTSYDSVRGKIVSNWRRENGRIKMDLQIPVSVSAEVWLPAGWAGGVRESGKAIESAAGVVSSGSGPDAHIFNVGSGHYVFEISTGKK